MSSPLKRPAIVGTSAASKSNGQGTEFPPLRVRSPKKTKAPADSHGAHSKRHKAPSQLPRVASVTFADDSRSRASATALPDNGEELEVLKCILVREGYIQRLRLASEQGKVSGSHLSTTIDVLDLLRIATIEVVEAIVAWRLKQHRRAKSSVPASDDADHVIAFQWNSLNYLLKLGSDLDFLEKHQGLIQWLGFTLLRNPFILPVNLDARAQLEPPAAAAGGGATAKASDMALHRLRRDDTNGQFVQIGGKRGTDDPRPDTAAQLRAQAAAAALAERKRAKNPYETRIVNDEELIPLARAPTFPGAESSRRPKGPGVVPITLPSQIGDLDMSRIRACEVIVLEEEALHGRYTHDIQGHLVPESEAARQRKMIELSGGAYGEHQMNGHRHPSALGSSPRAEDGSAELGTASSAPPGRTYAKKRAGMLGPISKPQPRRHPRKAPVSRSRGAHLEEVLQHEKAANVHLGLLVDRLREEIECKEMDLAYFESFPGVQFYGVELDEFRRKTRVDVGQLRRELAEKEYVYETRATNLHRKEEIIHAFKETHQAAVDGERAARIDAHRLQTQPPTRGLAADGADARPPLNQEPPPSHVLAQPPAHARSPRSDEEGPDRHRAVVGRGPPSPLVHHMCATVIQRIARGKLARTSFEAMKIEYFVGSKYIQAVIRGFLARRRVARMYWQLTASIVLQRYARGMLARRTVARIRRLRRIEASAVAIQRVLRGFFGRRRMRRIRRLARARSELASAAGDLSPGDLRELAAACLSMVPIPSLVVASRRPRAVPATVLGLVRILMVYTADDDDEVDVCNVRWREAALFLRCCLRLQRRMHKVAVAAIGRYLRASLLGAALMALYRRDETFGEATFRHLDRGWRAATAIYRWVAAFAVVTECQSVLPPYDLGPRGPFRFAQATTPAEAQQERVEAEEHATEEEMLERRYVPRELVRIRPHRPSSGQGPRSHRPRPIVLVVAFDVPAAAKRGMLERLLATLPGLFVVLNRRGRDDGDGDAGRLARARAQQFEILGADFATITESLSLGYSVILECDIGLTDAQQRRFLGAFSALKAAIKPSPLCLLLRGSLRNRRKEETAAGLEPVPSRPAAAGLEGQRRMADAEIKGLFEEAAEWLHRLARSEMADEMIRVSSSSSPSDADSAFVLVMEAVVILLTPSKRYEAPKPHASAVSWKLGRRLLASPGFLHGKLWGVRYESIARDNLRALEAYVRHPDWPSVTRAHATGELLRALSAWVETIVRCALLAAERQGLAGPITRTAPVPGLFGNVITFSNAPGPAQAPQRCELSGEELALGELLEAALADVRVYRRCRVLEGRRCVVQVFQDCERIYFSAYDPLSSWRWQSLIREDDVDALLAPNSIERGDVKAPPRTRDEMFERLVALLLLQPRRREGHATNATASATSQKNGPPPTRRDRRQQSFAQGLSKEQRRLPHLRPDQQELVARPRAIRLYRHGLRLGGHHATVTVAELSRGRVQVDVALHARSVALQRVVSLESILERLSHDAARALFVAPDRLPGMVLERLHLYRRRPTRHDSSSAPDDPAPCMGLVVRTRPEAPGRLVLRTAIRSPWLPSTTAGVWILSVARLETSAAPADAYRVELYQPRTSHRHAIGLSARAFEDLGLVGLCQHAAPPRRALRRLVKLLQCALDPDEPEPTIHRCTVRQIHLRLPLAIPFVTNPHHVVTAREVLRAHVQVETPAPEATLLVRIVVPGTCEEQKLELPDAEVDAWFGHASESWRAAALAQRKVMAIALLRGVLRFRPTTRRVVAILREGHTIEAEPCTRATGRSPATRPALSAARTKRSMFTARGSLAALPTTPSSCVRLLDGPAAEERVVFAYDRDEMVHKGSYRVTGGGDGVLVTVQVFMRATVAERLEPRFPVDRVDESDSFELAFHFYHPPTSAAATATIRGRTALREVVGPERPELIGSATVHELMEHIIATRTAVAVQADDDDDQRRGSRLTVAFHTDRLYAKQKATPINQLLDADATANAPKLIDAKPARGRKLLTASRFIAPVGRVLVTVFEASFTKAMGRQEAPKTPLELRVDAYVVQSSTRLSLTLEAVDLAHVAGEDAHLLAPVAGDETRRVLAQRVIDHLDVECSRDGSPDRLFLRETIVHSPDPRETMSSPLPATTRLLGKTVRHVGHAQVLVSVQVAMADGAMVVHLYEPQTSRKQRLEIPKPTLGLMLGLDPDAFTAADLLEREPTESMALLTHIVSFLHLEVPDPTLRGDDAQSPAIVARIELDPAQAGAFRDQVDRAWAAAGAMGGDADVDGPPWTTFIQQVGITTTLTGSSGAGEYCSVRLAGQIRSSAPAAAAVAVTTVDLSPAGADVYRVLVLAAAPRSQLLTSTILLGPMLLRSPPAAGPLVSPVAPSELLALCRRRLRIERRLVVPSVDDAASPPGGGGANATTTESAADVTTVAPVAHLNLAIGP